MCTTGVVFPTLLILHLLSISSLLAAIFGHSWWFVTSSTSSGLGATTLTGILRTCYYYDVIPERCEWRQNVFEFDNTFPNGVHLDVVLMLLTIATCSQTLSTLTTMTCTCCSLCTSVGDGCHTKRWWNTGTLSTAFFASIGAISSICAMAYTEVKLNAGWNRKISSQNDESWSYILGWVGASGSSLCMILSFLLLYLKPRPGYEAGQITSTGYNTGGSEGVRMKTKNNNYPQGPITDYTFWRWCCCGRFETCHHLKHIFIHQISNVFCRWWFSDRMQKPCVNERIHSLILNALMETVLLTKRTFELTYMDFYTLCVLCVQPYEKIEHWIGCCVDSNTFNTSWINWSQTCSSHR